MIEPVWSELEHDVYAEVLAAGGRIEINRIEAMKGLGHGWAVLDLMFPNLLARKGVLRYIVGSHSLCLEALYMKRSE